MARIPDGGVVGSVYGLRTLDIIDPLSPLAAVDTGTRWNWSEPCTATCSKALRKIVHDPSLAPHPDCSCGLYAFNNARTLFHRYPMFTKDAVLVVSLEGTVYEHELGYRAQSASVVAWWSPAGVAAAPLLGFRADADSSGDVVTFTMPNGSSVRMYRHLSDMLDDYGIPVEAPKPSWTEKLISTVPVIKSAAAFTVIGLALGYLLKMLGVDLTLTGIGVICAEWLAVVYVRRSRTRDNPSPLQVFVTNNISHITRGALTIWLCFLFIRSGALCTAGIVAGVTAFFLAVHGIVRLVTGASDRKLNATVNTILRQRLQK